MVTPHCIGSIYYDLSFQSQYRSVVCGALQQQAYVGTSM